MKKIWKGKKALSPVVAAIILIAVTVAVSIAVAAWMGALTFTFMGTEQLEIQGASFAAGPPKSITLNVQNTGTADLTSPKRISCLEWKSRVLPSKTMITMGISTS